MIAQRYQGTIEEDRLLAGWFARLCLSGDWARCFIPPPAGIGWFYAYFQRDVQLWYVTDEEKGEILLAGWFEPTLTAGSFFSLWVHSEHRHSRRLLHAYGELLEYGLDHTHIILGITKQETLLDGHRKMGYTVVGPILGLWGTGPAWLVTLTREQLNGGSYGRWRQCLNGRREELHRHAGVSVPSR